MDVNVNDREDKGYGPPAHKVGERIIYFIGTECFEGTVLKSVLNEYIESYDCSILCMDKSSEKVFPETQVYKWTKNQKQIKKLYERSQLDIRILSKEDGIVLQALFLLQDSTYIRRKTVLPLVEETPPEGMGLDHGLTIPDKLKNFLKQEKRAILRDKKIMNLPLSHTIDSVLDDYVSKKPKIRLDVYREEICDTIKKYFNERTQISTRRVLYNFERRNVFWTLERENSLILGTPVTAIYPPVYMLRMLYMEFKNKKINKFCPLSQVDDIQEGFKYFFEFLLERYDDYFSLDNYEPTSLQYQAKVSSIE